VIFINKNHPLARSFSPILPRGINGKNMLDVLFKTYPQLAEKGLQDEIAQVGKLMRFAEGDVIMDYGAYVKMVPLVLEGAVKVTRENDDGNEILLYFLRPGEACTMSFTCCMMHKKSEIRTVAEEDTLLIGIPVRYFDQWMNRYQSWKNFVMLSYDNRMLELIKTIESIAFQRMDERLLNYLRQKAELGGSTEVEVTHQQIAYDLNASREAVSRLLKKLEREGRLRLGRNRIVMME
jgi:CRP/FNR family transcriptional regulator